MVKVKHISRTGDCIIVGQVENFTRTCKLDCTEMKYVITDDWLERMLEVRVYRNVRCNENEGHVSILFRWSPPMLRFLKSCQHFKLEFNCTACILDANDDQKFLRSFAYVHEFDKWKLRIFGFDEYVKLDTLLSDPSELLPDDCLTVYIEFTYWLETSITVLSFLQGLKEFVVVEGHNRYINLDSTFAEILRSHSNVFRRLSGSPMLEKETGRMRLLLNERKPLSLIFKILLRSKYKYPAFGSIIDILETYVVAEKYDIQEAVEACRQLIKRSLNSIPNFKLLGHATESIPRILELAETYTDEHLRKFASDFLKDKEKLEADMKAKMEWNPLDLFRESSDYFDQYVEACREEEKEDVPQLDFYT